MTPRKNEYPSAALNWAAIPNRRASDTNIERSNVKLSIENLCRAGVPLRVAALDALGLPGGVDLPQPLRRLVFKHLVGIPLRSEGGEPHQDGDGVVPLLGQPPADEVRPLPSLCPLDNAFLLKLAKPVGENPRRQPRGRLQELVEPLHLHHGDVPKD